MDLSNQRISNVLNKVLPNLEIRNRLLHTLEQRLTQTLKVSSAELRMVGGAILISSLVVTLLKVSSSSNKPESMPPVEISTYIPKGQVLVPIQPKNFESVDSILGPFGYADLLVREGKSHSRLLVKDIRILRAPKNPSLFAVLVPQDHSSGLLEANEKGLYVVVKPKASGGTVFVKSSTTMKRVPSSRITYSSENL